LITSFADRWHNTVRSTARLHTYGSKWTNGVGSPVVTKALVAVRSGGPKKRYPGLSSAHKLEFVAAVTKKGAGGVVPAGSTGLG